MAVLLMAIDRYGVSKLGVLPGHSGGPGTPAPTTPRLEALWTVIPAIILVVVGVAAFTTLVTTDTIPQNPDVIVQINAHQWYWNFNITYVRNGTWLNSTHNFTYVNTTGAFTIQARLTVKLILRSFDVAHAFYLPVFLFKIDVIPGHTNIYWFRPDQPGDYRIECAEYCGLNHYSMIDMPHVVKCDEQTERPRFI